MISKQPNEEPPKPHQEGSDQACAILSMMARWKIPVTVEQIAEDTRLSLKEIRAALIGLLDRKRVRIEGDDRWMLR